jgi:GT2 family glycosyltransferase
MKPKVSIIILNYNGRSKLGPLLDWCINSAINQTYENIEVLFVDNGSTDDSYKYVEAKYGDKVKVIRFNRNYGFTLGNNLATKFASRDSKYLLFLNPDAVLDPDYVGGYRRLHGKE